MLSKQIHQEYESQVSVITRARSNRSVTGLNNAKGSKKGMKNITHTDSEYAQDGKHLSAEQENTLNESNSITNTKKMKRVNSSWSNLQLNETPGKLKMSSTLSDESKDNLCTTELSNNPVVSTLKLRKSTRNSRLSSRNLSPTKNYTVNSSKALMAPKMLTTNIDMIDTSKEKAFSIKESIVLVQKLHNIITIVLSEQSMSSSMVRVLVNDQFVNCNINVSRKTYDSVLSHLVTTETCHNRKTNSCTKIWQNVDYLHHSTENLCYVHGDASEPLLEPVMSSTPKDQQELNETASKREARRVKHECDTTLELNTNNTFFTQCQDHGNVKTDEVQGEVKQQNETYELIEPKTPILRKRLEEKHSDGGKKGVKKNFKVRFISPPMDRNCRLKCNAQYIEEKSFKSLTNIKKKILKSPANVRQRGQNSVSSRDESAGTQHTPCSKIGHSTRSFAKVNITTALHSVTRTTQSDPKNFSTVKKVPNFSIIHKNIFAKSKSVFDVKRRLTDRHAALTMAKVKNLVTVQSNLADEKQLPSKSNTVSYSQFGFKIRKQEATDCILRNNNIHVTSSTERRRAILNGVRTNRRFELQMKSRNINL